MAYSGGTVNSLALEFTVVQLFDGRLQVRHRLVLDEASHVSNCIEPKRIRTLGRRGRG